MCLASSLGSSPPRVLGWPDPPLRVGASRPAHNHKYVFYGGCFASVYLLIIYVLLFIYVSIFSFSFLVKNVWRPLHMFVLGLVLLGFWSAAKSNETPQRQHTDAQPAQRLSDDNEMLIKCDDKTSVDDECCRPSPSSTDSSYIYLCKSLNWIFLLGCSEIPKPLFTLRVWTCTKYLLRTNHVAMSRVVEGHVYAGSPRFGSPRPRCSFCREICKWNLTLQAAAWAVAELAGLRPPEASALGVASSSLTRCDFFSFKILVKFPLGAVLSRQR